MKIPIPFIPYQRSCGRMGRYQLVIKVENSDYDDTWREIEKVQVEKEKQYQSELSKKKKKELKQGLRKCPGHKDHTGRYIESYNAEGKCFKCGGQRPKWKFELVTYSD